MEPSTELNWVPCFDNPQLACARLIVPLDYQDTSAGTTNIAWIRYTSSNSSAEDVLFNPGGPGESGIMSVINGAERLLENLGSQYNLVGFDPRGVNNSGPALTCFPGAAKAAKAEYTPASSTSPLTEIYQDALASGEFCSKANADTEAKYAGSSATAQDMEYFINLNHAQKGLEGQALLNYYGISYGTALGQTFAALFPDRIRRMVLDGNVYGVQHYTGVLPSDVEDTDAAFFSFFQYCHNAGPEKCSFYGNSTTPEDMERRYLNILQNLREFPLVIADPSLSPIPKVLTDFEVSNQAFQQMYQPMQNFPKVADTLLAIESGDIKTLTELTSAAASESDPTHDPNYSSSEATRLITCLDANTNFPIKSYDDYLDARELYRRKSYYGGENSAKTNLLFCIGLSITPPPSQQFPGFDPTGTTTSFPILFLNPIRDPITPLSSAHKMSELFPGSVVLAQDSTGHSTRASESACTKQYTLAYMGEGSLPPQDTVCQADILPFRDTLTKKSIVARRWF